MVQTSETTLATLLMQKQKESEAVQAKLNRMKSHYHERMQACREREEKLAERQQELTESVRKFSKFVQENDLKRKRANQRANDEVKLREQKDQEIEALKVDVSQSRKQCEEYKQVVARDKQYDRYLDQVCELFERENNGGEDFGETSAAQIINRYEVLSIANESLLEKIKEDDSEFEVVRKDLAEYVKMRQNEILYLNNQLASYRGRLEGLASKSLDRVTQQELEEEEAKSRARMLGLVKMAIINLHRRAVESRSVFKKQVGEDDLHGLLEDTKVRMLDLIHIESGWKDSPIYAQLEAQKERELAKAKAKTDADADKMMGIRTEYRGDVAPSSGANTAHASVANASRAPGSRQLSRGNSSATHSSGGGVTLPRIHSATSAT